MQERPAASHLFVMRRTGKPVEATHLALAILTAGIWISPLLAPSSIPVMLGLLVLPLIAVGTTGVRSGLVWTAICTALLAAGAAGWFSHSLPEQALAWNATIVCACLGFGGVWIEYSRISASRDAPASRLRKSFEARNRAEAESSLQESQTLFSTLFQKNPCMLILSELATGRILDVNEAFIELSGWHSEEATGKNLTDLDAWPTPTIEIGSSSRSRIQI
jgi:PAS domain-containing protein